MGLLQPQSLSRADSGILYPGGSQGDSPTPNDTRTTTSEDVCNNSGGGSCLTERRRGVGTEECTTVGGKVELTSSVTEGHHRTQMVEEALGVGVETGARELGDGGGLGVGRWRETGGQEDGGGLGVREMEGDWGSGRWRGTGGQGGRWRGTASREVEGD